MTIQKTGARNGEECLGRRSHAPLLPKFIKLSATVQEEKK